MIYNNNAILEAIKIAKEVVVQCHLNQTGGTSLPGIKASEIYPDILNVISKGIRTILVTGTNGKTTTVRMISTILNSLDIRHFANLEGANVETGITTSFLKNMNIDGTPIENIAVIECDELFVPKMIKQLKPDILVLLPFFEDQKDRLKSPKYVVDIIGRALLESNAVVCINEYCQYSKYLIEKYIYKNKIIKYSSKNGCCKIDEKYYNIKLSIPVRYNYCNAAATLACMKAFGIGFESSLKVLEMVSMPFGRLEHFTIEGADVILTLIKNTVSLENTFDYLIETLLSKKYRVVLGINAKENDGSDISWVIDFPFEKYKNLIECVYVIGDVAEIVKKTICEKGIYALVINNIDALVNMIEMSTKPIFLMLNYTCMMEVRHEFAIRGYVKPFWSNE